jgi:hypothetical protein
MQTFQDWNDEVLTSIQSPTLFISGDQGCDETGTYCRNVASGKALGYDTSCNSWCLYDAGFDGSIDAN